MNISSLAELNVEVDSKQATLVSGTNIKSVGGISLLGSGDIPIVSSVKKHVGNYSIICPYSTVQLGSGGLFTYAATAGRMTPTNNNAVYIPFILDEDMTITKLITYIRISVASSTAQIGIYSSLDGVPNNKIVESAVLDTSTMGIKTSTIASMTLTMQTLYFYAVNCSSASVRGEPTLLTISHGRAPASETSYNIYTQAVGSMSLPNIATATFQSLSGYEIAELLIGE